MMFRILLLMTSWLTINLFAQTITHNGLIYGTVTSPTTNKVWLDRNLGATQACTSKLDKACFGDYFQWGRSADGHEKPDSKIVKKNAVTSSTTNHFITIHDNKSFDWRSLSDDKLWKDSVTNICPKGFKVPSIDELTAEVNVQFLKLPLAGYRTFCSGKLTDQNKKATLWSSTTYEKDAYYLEIINNKIDFSTSSRADGFSVRCIQAK